MTDKPTRKNKPTHSAKRLLAYEADDGQERTVVVFSASGIGAPRQAANELGISFEEVDYCRRAAVFDCHAPGPVPPLALIDGGWWLECHGCGRIISSDANDDLEEGQEQFDPVEDGQKIFCSALCQCRYLANELACKEVQDAAAEGMRADMLKRWPDARDIDIYAYAQKLDGGFVAGYVRAHFQFPGSKYAASYIIDQRNFGDLERRLYVAGGDADAWEAYTHTLKGPTAT